ncbi:MAG: helix-turn-helix domain-containing protein, partial [Actinomycetota bacterium]
MLEIGPTLREARIRRRLDIARCEAETRIRARYLRALEEEHFDSIPAPVYVKSFMKSYAEFLGVDAQLLIDEYSSRFEPEPEAVRHEVRRLPRRRVRARLPGGQLTLVALGGVVAVSLLVWIGAGDGGRTA